MYAFVFVVIAVVMTLSDAVAQKVDHLVLVKIHRTAIGIGVFVILIEFAGLTATGLLLHIL